jgi:hypothetical protein
MAETLGSLCDKLTVVKLKQYHTEDHDRLESLSKQENQLTMEIDQYLSDAFSGTIPVEQLSFAANKVYREDKFTIGSHSDSLGEVFAELAKVNCELWHEQEKVYDFEAVPDSEKNKVVKRLATLNLERVKCIDEINVLLTALCNK